MIRLPADTLKSLLDRVETLTGLTRPTLTAVALLLLGWIAAALSRRIAERLVERLGRIWPAAEPRADSAERSRVRYVTGRVAFWTVMLVALMAATELVGLPVLTGWLSGVTSYLPRVFAALVVFAVGVAAGRLVNGAVARAAASAGVSHGDRLGRICQVVVVAVGLLVATEQLGLELTFVTTALMIVLGSSLGAAALAFGLGSRSVVENILSGHYVRKLYEVGHVVRVDGVEGRILRMTPTAVILQASEGEVAVPAHELMRARTTLVSRGG